MSPTALSTHDSGCWLNGPPHEGVTMLPMLSNNVMVFAVKFVERRLPLSPKHIPVSSAEPLSVSSVSSRAPAGLKCLINPLLSPAKTSPSPYGTPAPEAVGAPNATAMPRVSVKSRRTSLERLICLPLYCVPSVRRGRPSRRTADLVCRRRNLNLRYPPPESHVPQNLLRRASLAQAPSSWTTRSPQLTRRLSHSRLLYVNGCGAQADRTAALITLMGAGTPVQSSKAAAPWATRTSRPSIRRAPAALAARAVAVGGYGRSTSVWPA